MRANGLSIQDAHDRAKWRSMRRIADPGLSRARRDEQPGQSLDEEEENSQTEAEIVKKYDLLTKTMEGIHVKYQKRMDSVLWAPVHVQYPVRKFPGTAESSKARCHRWREQPEVLAEPLNTLYEEKHYSRDHSCAADVYRSATTIEYGPKLSEATRHNKHTAAAENQYIYPISRKIEERPPMPSCHGTTEVRSSYKVPVVAPRLVTDKDQFRHPLTIPTIDTFAEPTWDSNLEPLDTTHEGFEKHLDPYLTTSRLHHRPFTADQLARSSNTKDVVTYYTFSNEPWIRTAKPVAGHWWLPNKLPKSMYDRDVFKQDRREIITHNKPAWTPGSFKTEVRDKFSNPKSRPQLSIEKYEEDTRLHYQRCSGKLGTSKPVEDLVLKALYDTESGHVGSGRQVCGAVEQHKEINKRLQRRVY